jgi:hypothetical protein
MPRIESLKAQGLPKSFDIAKHGANPIVTFSQQDNTIRINFTFPGFSFAKREAGEDGAVGAEAAAFQHEVGIAGTGFLSENGRPLLPSFGRFVQIPPGYSYQYRVKKSGLEKRSEMKIRPAQEGALDQEAGTFEFEQETYQEDKFYPKQKEMVEVRGPLFLDGYRVLCVQVRPMQYNPVKQILQCYSSIELSIELSEKKKKGFKGPYASEVAPWVYLDTSTNLEGFGNLLFNPERKCFEKAAMRLPVDKPTGARPDIPEYLIIYGAAIEEAARRLQVWKQKCGLDCAIVPSSCILEPAGVSISRDAQVRKLKKYIRDLRGTALSPLRYVLLFGDINTIPTEERKRPGKAATSLSDTTDYYYFTHRNAEDEECLMPWIAGGRIAAQDEAEGLAVVDQIIRYEKDPPSDPEYYRRMAVAAYFEDGDPDGPRKGRADRSYLKTMEAVRRHMRSNGFEVQRVYVTNNPEPKLYSDGTPVPLEVREEMIDQANGTLATKKLIALINEGQLIVGHRGHGNFLGWVDPPLRVEDMARISSAIPSIFFSINCRSGSFDSRRPCFAQRLLATNGGAPSLIAATELSGSWRNDSMIKALYDGIWPGVIPTYPVTTVRLPVKHFRIGDILNYAKAYLLLAHGINANTQKHLEIYHLFGDPTLQLWGSEPVRLQLSARVKGDILVINMNSCPQEGVLSVWYEDECLWKTKPSSPRMAVPLMLLDKLPEDARSAVRERTYVLSVYFSAAGHRLAESKVWF